MKLRYLFASLAAVMTLFTSCNDDFEPLMNDAIQVSTSYVSIPVGGGSTTVQLTTNDSYEIKGAPDWLTISPTSGAAGTSSVTFSADAYEGRNTEDVMIYCGSDSLRINVIQGISTVSKATCAEVIAGPDSKSYLVTGTCTAIANTTYGNFYLNDGTGEIYIYGTVNSGGSYAWSSFGIEVGDEVTVQGPKSTYNGTVELVDATFISVSKSLIKVDSIAPENGTLTSDGGDFEVYLVNKGTGLYVDVPEDTQSWLSIKSVEGSKVVFHAAANTAGPRNATLEFKTKSGGKDYTAQTSLTQEGLSGTKDVPFTVEEAIAYANKLGGESSSDYYIKGKVSKMVSAYSAAYGNGTFWISDDGQYNDDLSKDFEVYRALWFDNQKWADGNAALSEGDDVVICGHITVYKGTAETASGKAYVLTVNGVSTDKNGLGSQAAPFNAEGAIAAANAGCSSNVYVEGTVSKMVSAFSAAYGNGTFWISNDGNYYGDKTKDFEVYRALWFDNQKWVDGDATVAVGDKVVIYGLLTVYSGTAETSSGKAYVFNHIPAN